MTPRVPESMTVREMVGVVVAFVFAVTLIVVTLRYAVWLWDVLP